MNSDILKKQLDDIEDILKPILDKKSVLLRQYREAISIEHIEDNHIMKKDVELSTGDSKPWFGMISDFGKWLDVNSNKKYCEWNGRIYETSEIVAGRMSHDASGRVEDLRA